MNRAIGAMGYLLACVLSSWAQSNVVIDAFETSGHLVFDRVSNAASYSVEWSPAVGGAWTTFVGEATVQLHSIPGAGSGPITASVPMLYRVVATVTNPPSAPSGMVLIPAGSFVMGNATNVFPSSEGLSDELPQHTVNVSGFFMDIYEVTKALWDVVIAYNGGNGYSYDNPGFGKSSNHPVHTVNWWDVVKWCNARSQRDGLKPVYYTDGDLSLIYKTNRFEPFVDWSANGYRLPTEAEWEKAARGGVMNTRFPWTDFTNRISWLRANYYGRSNSYSYDISGGSGGYNSAFTPNGFPYTSPVGYFPPNGYGLHDMAGNVWEWCWDWYDPSFYASSPVSDPKGPLSPTDSRVLRGGAWSFDAPYSRISFRNGINEIGFSYDNVGFRCARSP